MDWCREDRENGKALRRIIALLLALAGLAERACGRSRPVRCLVLLALRPGEAVARDYVAGLTGVPAFSGLAFGVPSSGIPAFGRIEPMPGRHDGGIAEAMRLALVFRALAAALAALLEEAAAPAPRVIGVPAAFHDLLVAPAVELRDSS